MSEFQIELAGLGDLTDSDPLRGLPGSARPSLVDFGAISHRRSPLGGAAVAPSPHVCCESSSVPNTRGVAHDRHLKQAF